jgi:hypothetical protein
MRLAAATFFIAIFFAANCSAQLLISDLGAINQNFDALGTSLTLPENWRIFGYSGNPTWNTASTSVQFAAQSGSPTSDGLYNWGSSSGTNRAVGSLISQVGGSSLILRLKNSSNSTIQSFAVGFVVKQFYFSNWGAGGDVTFFHSRNASSWTPVPQFKTNLSATSSNQTHFFNNPPTFSVPARTFSVPLAPNEEIYFRWSLSAVSTSVGYGIDDIWITPVATPQPTSNFSFTSVGSGQIKITGYTGTAASVVIPASIGGNTVVGIAGGAFANKSGITLVEIPDTVAYIEGGAFYNCTNLSRVTIPYSVQTIADSAFQNCTKLTAVSIPASVSSIGNYAFAGCSALAELGILYGVTSIGEQAFAGCVSLRNLLIPGSVTEIGYRAFYDCTNLTSVWISYGVKFLRNESFKNCRSLSIVTMGNTLEVIGNAVFYGCHNLTALTIPSSVTTIGDQAIFDCQSLAAIYVQAANPSFSSLDGVLFDKSQTRLIQYPIAKAGPYSIPSSVNAIGDSAFYGCSALSSLVIPPYLNQVGMFAFTGCTGLSFVVTPGSSDMFPDASTNLITLKYILQNSTITIQGLQQRSSNPINNLEIPAQIGDFPVTRIGYGAFRHNTYLQTLNLPNSITSIEGWAFYDCDNLTSVTIPSSVTFIGEDAFYSCNQLSNLTIQSGVTSIGTRAFAHCYKLTSVTIPSTVTSIGDQAFFNCSALSNLTIQSGVTSIGTRAFGNCRNLTSVTIPSSVTSIGEYAFESSGYFSDGGLSNLTIQAGVTSIGARAFANCGRLTSATIPSSVTSIGDEAFSNCSQLSNLTIQSGVASIGASAFRSCSNLINVIIPSTITSMGDEAFSNCSQLSNLTIQAGVTSIGARAFAYCYKLTSVTIPSTVTSIGDGAFFYCSYLSNLTIQAGVTSIGTQAFASCYNLNGVTIPSTVTSIGYEAFSGCQLSNLTLQSGVNSIGHRAFQSCSNLTTVMIPSSVTSIGHLPFSSCSSLVSISVHEDNPNFSSLDGVLFNKSQTILIQYPPGKSGSYFIPEKVLDIGAYAFYGSSSLVSITVPASLETIGSGAFEGTGLLSILFKGEPPISAGALNTTATIYHISERLGWEAEFYGQPAQPFSPQVSTIEYSAAGLQFSWIGSGSIPMNVERTTSLQGGWEVVSTNNGTGLFLDTNPPSQRAFYRAVLP